MQPTSGAASSNPPLLKRLRHWMQKQHQALTATILVVFGCAMALYGITGT